MTVYSIYVIFLLILLFSKKGVNREFCVTKEETRIILIGLIIYCSTHLISATLIEFELKSESYRIIGHHAILLPACIYLFLKMIQANDK